MEWLAFAVVLIGTIYFAIHYPRFRRGLGYTALALVMLTIVGGLVAWFQDRQLSERRRVAKTLIPPPQIEITQATLSLGIYSELRATLTNRSSHHLSEIALRVTVTDCPKGTTSVLPPGFVVDKTDNPFAKYVTPEASANCAVIGEYVARSHVDIPSGQKRAISPYVSFPNMPSVKDGQWSWYYSIVEIVAKH